MRTLSNAIAGAAGMMVLFGALAATPATALGSGQGQHGGPAAAGAPEPELGECDDLRVPEGNEVAFRAYAEGVQIYRWGGASWTLLGPDATLYADAEGHGVVGIHYAGPTWESNSGSKVIGAVAKRCTPDPTAIQWLQLTGAHSQGPGIFDGVTFIQRINTSGGLAPVGTNPVVGEVVRVPYTAEYVFYKARN